MKKLSFFFMAAFLLSYSAASAQNATTILEKADSVLNAPKDVTATSTMTITAKNGSRSVRTMQVFQKGTDKRLVRFLSPADQKGIAFLSLPNDNQILYLPAFGKTRRIASHVKNTRFAGTDYTYEDLEAKRYADKWDAELKSRSAGEYTLSLTPKKGVKTDYAKMDIRIKADTYFPVEVVFYNEKGVASKRMTVSEISNHKGFLIAKTSEMKDLSGGSSTQTHLQHVELNTGLKDDVFTERNLMK